MVPVCHHSFRSSTTARGGIIHQVDVVQPLSVLKASGPVPLHVAELFISSMLTAPVCPHSFRSSTTARGGIVHQFDVFQPQCVLTASGPVPLHVAELFIRSMLFSPCVSSQLPVQYHCTWRNYSSGRCCSAPVCPHSFRSSTTARGGIIHQVDVVQPLSVLTAILYSTTGHPLSVLTASGPVPLHVAELFIRSMLFSPCLSSQLSYTAPLDMSELIIRSTLFRPCLSSQLSYTAPLDMPESFIRSMLFSPCLSSQISYTAPLHAPLSVLTASGPVPLHVAELFIRSMFISPCLSSQLSVQYHCTWRNYSSGRCCSAPVCPHSFRSSTTARGGIIHQVDVVQPLSVLTAILYSTTGHVGINYQVDVVPPMSVLTAILYSTIGHAGIIHQSMLFSPCLSSQLSYTAPLDMPLH
ncbi:hypothetical protein J6590_070202 [Homalodisca vitripennis]|nr:hypothetical protein J6590_070202 [Homalodisca vitripennis]